MEFMRLSTSSRSWPSPPTARAARTSTALGMM